MSHFTADEEHPGDAELTRLADGSLPPEQAAAVRERVQASPQLTRALAEQQQAVSLLRSLDAPAPDALRARVEDLTQGARSPRRRRRRVWHALALPGMVVAAVAVAAIVVLLSGGGASPSVTQTARVALAAATLPAPAADPAHPGQLDLRVGTVAFPKWTRGGWSTAGARTDTLSGRRVTTVFYTRAGARVGYAIVSGSPLPGISGTRRTVYNARFTLARRDGARLVTWVRDGHTCVIAARSASYATLLSLAREDR